MRTGSLLAVCLVHGLLPTKDATGVTAIDKRPVDGAVQVHPLGLTGDLQASRKHHGGESKAVYAYSQDDADIWARELGRDIPPGLFGENLRLAGIDATSALIGERWRIGADVEVEVSCPRTPCRNFQRRMGEPNWARRFAEEGRVGAYLSVRRRGSIAAGDPVEVLNRPGHGVRILDVFRGLDREQAAALQASATARDLCRPRKSSGSCARFPQGRQHHSPEPNRCCAQAHRLRMATCGPDAVQWNASPTPVFPYFPTGHRLVAETVRYVVLGPASYAGRFIFWGAPAKKSSHRS